MEDYFTTIITLLCILFVVTTGIILYLRHQLNHPIIVSYPWPSPSSLSSSSDKEKTNPSDSSTNVVIAGSYNPPHYGHLEMIIYLAKRYNKVHVVLGMNPNKKYQVSPTTRAQWLETMLDSVCLKDQVGGQRLRNKIQVDVTTGYIWRHAKSKNVNAKILFRGIRTWAKDGMEERALHKLNLWGPMVVGRTWPVQTRYLEGKPELINISSTVIRNLCNDSTSGKDGDEEVKIQKLEKLVPRAVATEIAIAYRE